MIKVNRKYVQVDLKIFVVMLDKMEDVMVGVT